MEIVTIPSKSRLDLAAESTPEYMRPNRLPTAVVAKEILSPTICEGLVELMTEQPVYSFHGCAAYTREAPQPLDPMFDYLDGIVRVINEDYWDFELDPEPAAWMQTYTRGGSYQRHMDDAPGQTRKLTAVVMLSFSEDYNGGQLRVVVEPEDYPVSRAIGTVVVFPSWVPHFVTEVTSGVRRSINLGYWGPSFR